ncbi:MAG: VWA domain-containing protein [Acidobacteriia bacterium]|nr:VWA domain-containing protein [Terriglobia bacterium]
MLRPSTKPRRSFRASLGMFSLAASLGCGWILSPARIQPAQSLDSGMIRGTVLDDNRHPVDGARVGVLDATTGAMKEARTDSRGQFAVINLSRVHLYRVVVTKFGYSLARTEALSPDGSEVTLTITPVKEVGPRTSTAPPPKNSSPEPVEPVARFKVDVSLVRLNVSVKDAQGMPVLHLNKDNFTVADNGATQPIVQFHEENTPESVVLMMDISSSMEGTPIQQAKRAAIEFVRNSPAQSELAIVTFNDVIRVAHEFTNDRAALEDTIAHLEPRGGTALFDALLKSQELFAQAHTSRHFIVVFSDGEDTDSSHRFSDVQSMAQSSDVVIDAIGEYSGPERQLFMTGKQYYKMPALEENYNPVWVLRQFSQLTGGVSFFPAPSESLASFFVQIAEDLHHQYVIAYAPPEPRGQSGFHRIDVHVIGIPGAEQFQIRTRQGYSIPAAGR